MQAPVYEALYTLFVGVMVLYNQVDAFQVLYMQALALEVLDTHSRALRMVQGCMALVLYRLVVGGKKRVLGQGCKLVLEDIPLHVLLVVDNGALGNDKCFEDIDYDVGMLALVDKRFDGDSFADIRMRVGMVFVVDTVQLCDDLLHTQEDELLDAPLVKELGSPVFQHVVLYLVDEVGR